MTLLSLLFRPFSRLVVDIPSSLDACESCRVDSCLRSDWEKCPTRLATMEAVDRSAREKHQIFTMTAKLVGLGGTNQGGQS